VDARPCCRKATSSLEVISRDKLRVKSKVKGMWFTPPTLALLAGAKLLRAHDGCLGARKRRRTWLVCDKPRGADKQALIRAMSESGNRAGAIQSPTAEFIGGEEQTSGSETSQYGEEKKSKEILLVVASERGTGQTQ
jgi:hypothetical protein